MAQVLASLISEGGMRTFRQRQQVLESIIKIWQQGKEVLLCDEEMNEGQLSTATCDAHDYQETDMPEGEGADTKIKMEEEPDREPIDLPIVNENKSEEALAFDPKEEAKSSTYADIKMPPKILKRGRPKGLEVTVIGLPKTKKKKEQKHLIPFCKLTPAEKDRQILEYLVSKLAAGEAMEGQRLLKTKDLLPIGQVSEAINDHENVDIHRIQKYFDTDAWLDTLQLSEDKSHFGWLCPVCAKVIDDDNEDSIACDRCLLWSHFGCTSLKKRPKNKNWFCRSCKSKFT